MKQLKLSIEPDDRDWSMQFMDDRHYDLLIEDECEVLKPDGSPLLTVLRNPFTKLSIDMARPVFKKIRMRTENRSVASGTTAVPRKKKNGQKSKTTRVPRGWEVMSGLVGYFERSVRFPYAHACAWNLHNPDLFPSLFPILGEATSLFASYRPERFAAQMQCVERTHRDFVIPGTAYTTVTVNHNFRTACHKDAGDLEAGFSNMLALTEGRFAGGNLVLPRWRLGVKLGDGDFILFDAHEWHGNTQIIPIDKRALRTTAVCYYREDMQYCKSAKEELAFAKNRKPGDPLFPEKIK